MSRQRAEAAITLGRDGVAESKFTVEQASAGSGAAFVVGFVGVHAPVIVTRYEAKRMRAALDSVLARTARMGS